MSDKKNIIIGALIFVLFFLIFPLNLVSNISYQTGESLELTENITPLAHNKMPYIYKNRAGYFSPDLKSSWSMDIRDGVTLLSDSYINRSRENNSIDITTLDGSIKYSIKDDGYPFSLNNRLFIIDRNRKGISEIVSGERVWTKIFNYLITSIDGSDSTVVIGFTQGFFAVLDQKGELVFKYEPGGSRVPIIYSVAISEDDNYIALISGLDPQRYILYEKRGLEYKPLYTENLREDIRMSRKLIITNDSVFIEGEMGFYIMDIESKDSVFVKDNYDLKNVEYIEDMDIYMVLTGAVNYNSLKLLTSDNRLLLEKKFLGENVSVFTRDNSLYTVIDNSVIKLDIKE